MKKYLFLLVGLVTFFLSSEARPDTDKWIKCLYGSGHDCSAGGPPASPCQVVRGKDPCKTDYYRPGPDGTLEKLKCCSAALNGIDVGGRKDDVEHIGDYKIYTLADKFHLIGEDEHGFKFPIYDYISMLGDNWNLAVEKLSVSGNVITIETSKVQSIAPFYDASTTTTQNITLAEIIDAYGQAIIGGQANRTLKDIYHRDLKGNTIIIEGDGVDLVVKNNNWDDIEYEISTKEESLSMNYSVLDINGVVVDQATIKDKTGNIDLSGLRTGLYIFMFETNVGVIRKKYYKFQ
ncbi:MAG: T9SS type A sorting domain-containing protein [Bacteroidia bacterium]|jgi:hypothetical protein|nr:T9SS type A sorting domain-containing protein [Bacteroidia bacterium]